jgi:hypothetical protein
MKFLKKEIFKKMQPFLGTLNLLIATFLIEKSVSPVRDRATLRENRSKQAQDIVIENGKVWKVRE